MKYLALVTFVCSVLTSYAQRREEEIKKIRTIEDANLFIAAHPKIYSEIIEINSGLDSSVLAKKITANNSEEPFVSDSFSYKVIEARKSFLLRVSYIYLDGTRLTMNQIDSLRKLIIRKYNSGIPFAVLAKEYTMDGNPNTDLGWVSVDMLVNDFSNAVKQHQRGEIFTVDVPDKKWYHVTLKTFDDREVKIFSVLKIKNNN
jgi:hypothetical protein